MTEKNGLIDDIINFATALEAACVDLKRRLAGADYQTQTAKLPPPLTTGTSAASSQTATPTAFGYDPEKINYVERKGPKGSFELATPENNVGNRDFEVLTGIVKEKKSLFGATHLYWMMQDGKSVGRKPRTNKA